MSTAIGTLNELQGLLDSKGQDPAYNLTQVTQALDSFKDPVALVTRISAARKQRLAEEDRRREKNRQNRESLVRAGTLEQDQEEHDPGEEADDAAAAAAIGAPMQDADEDPEPAATEALCLMPRQPAVSVDLSPLQLDAPAGAPQRALLAALLAAQQLLDYAGACDADSASPVLRVLFQLVAHGDCPHAAYRQAAQYYADTDAEDMGWVPQLSDFWSALQALGYQAPRGHGGGGGSRKRSNGDQAGDGAAAAGGSGGGGVRLANLRSLLQLLADLLGLQQQGRLDLGCGSQAEATGKGLITAVLRMLLDADISTCLYPTLLAALEGLMGAWDDTVWRRLGDATAAQAAEMGPSHRAACRLIASVQGMGERVRSWQAAAALALLRRVVPPSIASAGGASGAGGGHRRGAAGPEALASELRALLGGRANAAGARTLKQALRQERDGKADMWRLLTILQCANTVARHAVYYNELDDGGEFVRWLLALVRSLEQLFKRQGLETQVLVLLSRADEFYDVICRAWEH